MVLKVGDLVRLRPDISVDTRCGGIRLSGYMYKDVADKTMRVVYFEFHPQGQAIKVCKSRYYYSSDMFEKVGEYHEV
jgi:hypothetical protein